MLRGNQLTDSTTLQNGTFELKGTTEVPKTAMLVVQRSGKLKDIFSASTDRIRVFLEPGPVVLTSPDSLINAKITGSQLTAQYNALQASLQPLNNKAKALGAKYRNQSPEQRQAPESIERMRAEFEALNQEGKTQYITFVKANPKSWVSLDALNYIGGMAPQYAELSPLYEALSPQLRNSLPGRKYAEMLQSIKAISIGAPAPDFTQKTPDGRKVSLTDYRGKYVLVDFWASWCGPCRQENPAVTKVYNTYKNKNFDILSISLDTEANRAKWLKAVQDDQLAWTQVSDLRGWQNEAAIRYHVQAIPQNFLIDPTGKIVATNLHGSALREALMRYIK